MTIRTRLTLWFAGMLLGSFLLMIGVLHYELVGEYEQRGRKPESPTVKIEDILLFYGGPTLIVLVLGGSWLVHRALRPVETLAATAERVHAGNLAERIPRTGRGDEIDRLAGVFNEMLARVEAGVASVREFTLHASHELKTPLTILAAETEIALGDATFSASQRRQLESHLEEIRRFAGLVDALAFLARVDAGVPALARESLRLDELLRAAVEDSRVLAAPHEISVELMRCDAVPLDGDRAALRQVLLNLLDNAVKHNQPHGWIRIELRADAEAGAEGNAHGFALSIENTGAPISAELIPRLFDRFLRGPSATEGSGLGLSIVKRIVEAHGGSIGCVSRADGIAQFVVRMAHGESISRRARAAKRDVTST